VQGHHRYGWYGVLASPGAPKDVGARLNAAISEIAENAKLIKLIGLKAE
jgi:tripartite-type tricarboxylate transporter receptor subunit TctC